MESLVYRLHQGIFKEYIMAARIEVLIQLVKELTEKIEQQQSTIDRIESLVDEIDNRV